MRSFRRSTAAAAVALATMALTACISTADEVAPEETPPPPASSAPAEPTPTMTPDPWAGYFDEQAQNGATEYEAQFWGSFGDVGAVAPSGNRDERLPAGAYTVDVSCAGEADILVSATDLEGTDLTEPTTMTCPMSTVLGVTTAAGGLEVTLDPQGDTGAFLVRIAEAP
jgi:hypothetical protein